mgnify:CR=1 FL=1
MNNLHISIENGRIISRRNGEGKGSVISDCARYSSEEVVQIAINIVKANNECNNSRVLKAIMV